MDGIGSGLSSLRAGKKPPPMPITSSSCGVQKTFLMSLQTPPIKLLSTILINFVRTNIFKSMKKVYKNKFVDELHFSNILGIYSCFIFLRLYLNPKIIKIQNQQIEIVFHLLVSWWYALIEIDASNIKQKKMLYMLIH